MNVKAIEPIVKPRERGTRVVNDKAVEILLVEDNPGDVILIEESLKEGKFKVKLTVVDDGTEAISYLKRETPYLNAPKPDLVILDLNLPRVDGHQILKTIREMDEFKQIPVVILTTSNVGGDIKKAYDAGATCFITKPFGFNNFMEAVKTIEHFWFNVATLPSK